MTHDALPAGLVEARPQEGIWVWRCHLDVSHPQRRAWTFLRQFVVKYDAAVFSLPVFAQRLPIPQFMIYPAIDPLSDKNRELSPAEVDAILERLGVPRDRPILLRRGGSTVSRPARRGRGVLPRSASTCRLVGRRGRATIPGVELSAEVHRRRATAPTAVSTRAATSPEVNALQRAATIVFQKSTRKASARRRRGDAVPKPVIGAAGGITAQIVYG